MNDSDETTRSTTAEALAAAGDSASAVDIAALDNAARAADEKLATVRRGLVERLIYGPRPTVEELRSGARLAARVGSDAPELVDVALACLASGEAFSADGKLAAGLRRAVAEHKGYGFTVPVEYGGAGKSYAELAGLEEALAANGLGPLAVEISGELTIGAGSVLGYGNPLQKKTFLPMIVEGELMGFALTEVGVGVNAKKIQAYVELSNDGDYRLFADGERNKLWITNARHGALLGLVARIGKGGKDIGLFVIQLPETDVVSNDEGAAEFSCTPSHVAAFTANYNARLHFKNFPIPAENRIPADGVEVLFYCLRMGRCMLAAMAAGYQRMLAADAAHYAARRIGVGGPVIGHELPRFALGRILGGALQSRALAFLALQQDAEGVDLAGLRDLTKSAASAAGLESMIACEHVMGGRGFHDGSRVNAARVNLHLFGVVEGEDDMIRMGMVRDVTARFVDEFLSGMLGALRDVNEASSSKLLRISARSCIDDPRRSFAALRSVLSSKTSWRLAAWIMRNGFSDAIACVGRLVPAQLHPRYRTLPAPLRGFARYAERRLHRLRWIYLAVSFRYQLELTRAQIPLQRFGLCIEYLVAMLIICHHAACEDESQQRVAALQSQLLKDKFENTRLLRSIGGLEQMRRHIAAIGDDLEAGRCSLLTDIEPEPFAHPWQPDTPS